MATLRLVPASGPPVDIDGDQAIVGRDPGCEIVVNDVSVSRKHARVERWGGNWAVVDQRSANGTFLDGKRVVESIVRTGQELRFGAVAYRVEIVEDETGATVLMSMPAIDATVLHSAAGTPRPPAARPAPPPPPVAPPPVAEPVAKGKGPLFWSVLGCGGLLIAAALLGAIFGRSIFGPGGVTDAVHSPPAGAAIPSPAPDSGGLVIETVAVNKGRQGQALTVKIDVRVTGFALRPEGKRFRVDLAEDLETFGADGKRIDELSRVGLETFNQTADSAADATATFNTSLTFSQPDPGRYRAVITIRDLVGLQSKKHEVPFDLP